MVGDRPSDHVSNIGTDRSFSGPPWQGCRGGFARSSARKVKIERQEHPPFRRDHGHRRHLSTEQSLCMGRSGTNRHAGTSRRSGIMGNVLRLAAQAQSVRRIASADEPRCGRQIKPWRIGSGIGQSQLFKIHTRTVDKPSPVNRLLEFSNCALNDGRLGSRTGRFSCRFGACTAGT